MIMEYHENHGSPIMQLYLDRWWIMVGLVTGLEDVGDRL